MASELPPDFGATPFLQFYHGEWQRLLEVIEIPERDGGRGPSSWDRKAAYLLWLCSVDEVAEDIYPAMGRNEILNPPVAVDLGPTMLEKALAAERERGVQSVNRNSPLALHMATLFDDNGIEYTFNSQGILPL